VAAEELAHWGRSVDHLVNTGKLAMVNEVVAGDASIEALVNGVVAKADELGTATIAKLHAVLPQVEHDDEDLFATIHERADEFLAQLEGHDINLLEHSSDESLLTEVGRRGLSTPEAAPTEGDGASGADGDPGGVDADASESQPSAGDHETTTEPETQPVPEPAVETPSVEEEHDPAATEDDVTSEAGAAGDVETPAATEDDPDTPAA
jgi:hypothetical protein